MPWFIKTERFTKEANALLAKQRQEYIKQHHSWIIELHASGIKVSSGYLVDKEGKPGGGGLLIIEADSFEQAKYLVEQDPMIVANLVTWKVQEWIPVYGALLG